MDANFFSCSILIKEKQMRLTKLIIKWIILWAILMSKAYGWDCEQESISDSHPIINIKIGNEYFKYILRKCKKRDITKVPWYEIDAWVYMKLLDAADIGIYGVFPSDPDYPIIVPAYRIDEIKERLDMNQVERFWIDLTK